MGALGNHRPGSNDGIAFYHYPIHYDGAHANKHIVVNAATMHNGVVANAYVVANGGGVLLVGAVDAGAILHVYAVAQCNGVDIAAHHRVKPKAARIAGGHLPNDGGIWGNIAVGAKAGQQVVYGQNDGHGNFFLADKRPGLQVRARSGLGGGANA